MSPPPRYVDVREDRAPIEPVTEVDELSSLALDLTWHRRFERESSTSGRR
jgi:hypothetical protein